MNRFKKLLVVSTAITGLMGIQQSFANMNNSSFQFRVVFQNQSSQTHELTMSVIGNQDEIIDSQTRDVNVYPNDQHGSNFPLQTLKDNQANGINSMYAAIANVDGKTINCRSQQYHMTDLIANPYPICVTLIYTDTGCYTTPNCNV